MEAASDHSPKSSCLGVRRPTDSRNHSWTYGPLRRQTDLTTWRSAGSRSAASGTAVLGGAKTPSDLGEDFGHGLTAAEVDYLIREEWARAGEDVLWRRTKCGLAMAAPDAAKVAAYVARSVPAVAS